MVSSSQAHPNETLTDTPELLDGAGPNTVIDIPFEAGVSKISTPPPDPVDSQEMGEYVDIHAQESKIKPFFSVDAAELTMAFKKRGIYHEPEKDGGAAAIRSPTPIRLARPLSKVSMATPGATPVASPSSHSPHDADGEKISTIQENLTEAKDTMLENLKSLVKRGPELEHLQRQSADLEHKTSVFRKKARKAERTLWIKRMSSNIVLIVTVSVIVGLLLVSLLKFLNVNNFR